ncbi:unnamed protein product [Phyllotreta striolata]|uniref:RETREG1-3/ARL6IP-like N-terminal reticulon-homology domain-containing protein n=1 Tax=Phyllotreta striolata TaxID=444603 RepID=A0A9N9XTR3_PHYSR|nr:unnamed protein product [Phyllotreta striolata]
MGIMSFSSEIEDDNKTLEASFIGDSFHPYTSKFNRFYNDNVPVSAPSDYKMAYAPTMESQIRKLRLSMEEYRELILSANSVLLWEKQWYPTAILTACTVLFTLLWLSDPTVLTVFSTIGLLITIGDYILPTLIASLYKSDNWTADKQSEYEEICTNIVLYKTKFELLVTSYCRMRITNSKTYFGITIAGLFALAWLGNAVNNLLLSYLFVVMVLLLPGTIYNGFLQKGTEILSKIFSDLVENAKSKVGQKKLD